MSLEALERREMLAADLRGRDIWLSVEDDGQAYEMRLGAGGVISAIRNEAGESLLARSFQGEATDRVVQWTTWSDSLVNDEAVNLPEWARRYNVTQAGNAQGAFQPTIDVDFSPGQVDVYSLGKMQWLGENAGVFTNTQSALTRYTVDDRGFIQIRRVVEIGEVLHEGEPQPWDHIYFEAWTPLAISPETFDAVALSLKADGTPDNWKSHGGERRTKAADIPYYPYYDATITSGYAVAFDQTNLNNDALGVVFGKQDIVSARAADSHRLNLMSWNENRGADQGLAILPSLEARDVPSYSLFDQTIYLVPSTKLDAAYQQLLHELVAEIPAPALYRPSDIPESGELRDIYDRLQANRLETGTRTNHLTALTGIEAPRPALADNSAKVEDGVLSVAGTAASDNIVIAARRGKVQVTVNTKTLIKDVSLANITEIYVEGRAGNDQIELAEIDAAIVVDGGEASDVVIVKGRSSANQLLVDGASLLVNGQAVQWSDVEQLQFIGQMGSDTLTVESLPTIPLVFQGGRGTDTLIGPASDNTWFINGKNSVLNNAIWFADVENLVGGSFVDTFSLAAGQTLSGVIDGGGGMDVLDYSAYTSSVTVDLQKRSATGVSGFANIEVFRGSPKKDKVIGANKLNTWNVLWSWAVYLDGTSLQGFEELVGGSADDVFVIGPDIQVFPRLDGGKGRNTLDYSQWTTGVVVDLQKNSATSLSGGMANFSAVFGGSGDDVLTGSLNSLLVGNAGHDRLIAMGGNNLLVGGDGDDTLTGHDGRDLLIGGLGADALQGGRGEDLLISGFTNYDRDIAALDAIFSVWGNRDKYDKRVDTLQKGSRPLGALSVFADSEIDRIEGGRDRDWFFATWSDVVVDLERGERLQ